MQDGNVIERISSTLPHARKSSNGTYSSVSDAIEFFQSLFSPGDMILFRPIETWTEANRKKSKVDYKGIQYTLVGLKDQNGQWQSFPQKLATAFNRQIKCAEQTYANIFFGVCPRFGTEGQYDQAWQIRVVRVLWTDIDHCTPEEALERCKVAGLSEPSIVVASGNGVHLYWILSDPYLIDDAGDPLPVFTEFINQGEGKKKKARKYIKDQATGEALYLSNRTHVPGLSPKAQWVQDVLGGIASKIGGDHTTDLSRLLRVPGTVNRKDQRNSRKPIPCRLVKCNADKRFSIDEFARFVEESPDRQRREVIAKVKLPAPRKLSPSKCDKFHELLLACDAAQVGTRSETDFALCCFAFENGIGREEVWNEAQNIGKFQEAGDRYFNRTWQSAQENTREKIYLQVEKKTGRSGMTPGINGKGTDKEHIPTSENGGREITVGPDESRVIDEAIEALAPQENIYQRGGCLVQVVQGTEPPRGIARPKDAPRVAPMRPARLRELLADAAVWYRPVGDDELERIHPPDWVVKAIEARGQWHGVRRLEAVVEVPVLRADGTILRTPGYDASTGIIFQPQTEFPRIPEQPTRADAQHARDTLLEVVEDFPFATEAHRAGWLAGTLTPLARYAFHGPAPLFLFDANVRGCGKSLLTDATSEINTGREMARMSQPHNDDEFRKRITAIAVAGEPLILIDNLDRTFGSASLDAALTATSWSDRILKTSEMASGVPLFATWYATGNNVIMAADTARRTLHIRLDSPEENPEERSAFHHPKLLLWVRQERPRLAAAAVTILAAYSAAGRPVMGLTPWGSFEAWSDLVRQAIVWSGMPDPGTTRGELSTQADREAVALRQLIAGWSEIDPSGTGMTVATALKTLIERPNQYEGLRAALWELALPKDGKTLNPRSIGMKLHHLRRRVVDGKFLDRKDDSNGTVWRIGQPAAGRVRPSTGTNGTTGTSQECRVCAYARAHA